LGATSSPTFGGCFFERMNSAERRVEFPQHFVKWYGKRRPTRDQHVVVALLQPAGVCCAGRRRQSHHFSQSAAHPVALHGVAYLS